MLFLNVQPQLNVNYSHPWGARGNPPLPASSAPLLLGAPQAALPPGGRAHILCSGAVCQSGLSEPQTGPARNLSVRMKMMVVLPFRGTCSVAVLFWGPLKDIPKGHFL